MHEGWEPVLPERTPGSSTAFTVLSMVRYNTKSANAQARQHNVELGTLDALLGVIDAVEAGELDAQLTTAAQERSKAFERRTCDKGGVSMY